MLKRITLLTNVCFEPWLRTYIKERFLCLSCEVNVNIVQFEEYRNYTDNFVLADTIIVCLNFDQLYPDQSNAVLSGKTTYETVNMVCTNKCRELYNCLKDHSNANIIWFGFEDYYFQHCRIYGSLVPFKGLVDKLNLFLNGMLKEDTFIDFKRLIATVGIKKTYDTKGRYRWNAPYSKELISIMADEIYKQHLIATGNTKKCLVLDCDNVLWGGVLSEDGITGIQVGSSGLGRPFQDFQRYLLDLYYHGVILAVCSKNDESDVLHVFREHTGMLLQEEHIAYFKCNWNNKPDNIKNISDTLNIGLDSIVFVDDSFFEIESVKSILPQVTTVLYSKDTAFDELSCFNLKWQTSPRTISERISTYKNNIYRDELKKYSSSLNEYISSLNMNVDIHVIVDHEFARVSELTQRTNKCTNGKRYQLNEIISHASCSDITLYTVSVSDRFSNLGLVGAMEINGDTLTMFSLSCRALGRTIENKMIDYLLDNHSISKVEFQYTTKNEELKDIFEKHLQIVS